MHSSVPQKQARSRLYNGSDFNRRIVGISCNRMRLCRVVKERCDHSLINLVEEYQEHYSLVGVGGLPPHDVIMLAFMLLDGLTTIHEYAKSLHLNVHPQNVLIERNQQEDDELVVGIAQRSIRLVDDGLCIGRLPASLVNKISGGMSNLQHL